MKKISLFSFLATALLCVGQNVMAQKTLFTYTIAEGTAKNATNIQATGGVVDLNVNAVETKNNLLGAKLSSDNHYILCKLADGVTLQTGDVIELKIFQNSTSTITDATTYGVTVASAISGVTTFDGTVYVGTSDGKGLATGSFTVSADLNGKSTFYVRRNSTKSMYCQAITISRPVATQDDATLKAIKIGDAELEGFDAATTEYNVELSYGTTTAPEVIATPNNENLVPTIETEATGENAWKTTITITAEDGTTTKTYTINFTVSTSVSTDATLKSLSIDGNAIAGFRADSLDYKYEIAYTAAIPVISAEVNDAAATMEITQITETPGTATVVVTAQDGTTKTYTVAISRAAAIKHLTVVPFSNGAKGAIDESALTVTVPYLAGTDEPTVDAAGITTSGDGASAALSEDGKTITLTGADGVSTAYTVVLQPLAANSKLGTNLITFDGTETYIFGVYGFGMDKNAGKGWMFSKNVDEESNMRNASGKTRIYMALPPAKSVDLTSGTGGARDVKIFVNGVQSSVTATEAKDKAITLTLNESQDNFIAIESNQTKGDGGFTAMQLAKTPEGPETSFEQAEVSVKAVKVVRNGQLFILRDGKTYNAQGIVVE